MTVILCGVPRADYTPGDAPVQGKCPECDKVHELCPECGSPAFSVFGMGAANGMGLYWVCDSAHCDYHYTPPGQKGVQADG